MIFRDIPQETQPVLAEIEKILDFAGDSIREIYLIGSRANNSSREDSDWDLLVFANLETMKKFAETGPKIFSLRVDLLIVCNGQNFKSPFEDKSGTLESWGWEKIDGKYFYSSGGTRTGMKETIRLFSAD